ncbi:hypothetical protein Fmac_030379 [Flemingia macrophylla]|uniref:Uncharacterized protein n=1 Tax=Flemingia macrophylla TaxID=520843 RepID=A0ABD1LEM5_9FABA
MMKLLKDKKEKKFDSKKRKEEFQSRLRGDDGEDSDEEITISTQQSIRSQHEWEDRQRFRQQTRGASNIYESGGSSRPNVSSTSREDINFALRSTNVDLVRSRSVKQAKISGGLMKTLKKKLGEAVSKFIIYERLPMNISNSPWLHNLIVAAAEVGPSVKFEHGSDVYQETFEGTKNVIMRLERNMDDQIKALNSLVLFKDKDETFATPQAQRAWSRMNPGMIPPDHSFPYNSRDNSQARRGKKKQNVSHEEYSSSSHIEQSFSDFNIDDSSESSQGHYPPSVYQYPYFNAYNSYASGQVPSYHQPIVNSHSPYYQQQSSGFFDYVFGQGATQGDSQRLAMSDSISRSYVITTLEESIQMVNSAIHLLLMERTIRKIARMLATAVTGTGPEKAACQRRSMVEEAGRKKVEARLVAEENLKLIG